MSWPAPEPGMPADDYTREHRALYHQLRCEADRPVPEPDPSWFDDGPTAQWAFHREQEVWADALERLVAQLAGAAPTDAAA